MSNQKQKIKKKNLYPSDYAELKLANDKTVAGIPLTRPELRRLLAISRRLGTGHQDHISLKDAMERARVAVLQRTLGESEGEVKSEDN